MSTRFRSTELSPIPRLLGWLGLILMCCFTSAVFAGQVTLAWDASAGATGYRVYQEQTDETSAALSTAHVTSSSSVVATVTSTTATVSNLVEGKTYYFAVKAYDSTSESGFSNETGTTLSVVAPAPSASFSANTTSGIAPLTVKFTDSSTNATNWSWNFGDNTTSTAQNPSKTYSSAGTYTVSLTATGTGGSNTLTKTNYITVTAPSVSVAAPVASFTTNPADGTGTAPLMVTFTDTSTGSIANRVWDFGDGTSSTSTTAQTTMKTYAAGSYIVKLTVSNSGGSNTMTKTISTTTAVPVVDFSATPTSGPAPLTVSFANGSSGDIKSWSWSFGDGGTSTAQNPSHAYDKEGTYTVSLTATSSTGTKVTKTLAGYVTVSPANTNTGGLVAAYNFNKISGTTVVDASGNGNDGVISGATLTSSGKFGNALSFNGVNNRVSLGRKLDFVAPFTAEAWIYPTSYADWRAILTKRDSLSRDDMRFDIGLTINTGTLYVYDGAAHTSSYTPPLNTWTHVAVVIDDSNSISLYVNGAFKQSLGTLSPGSDGTAEVMIGNNGDLDDPFNGLIDEVRIYNHALTASEIKIDMDNPITIVSMDSGILEAGEITLIGGWQQVKFAKPFSDPVVVANPLNFDAADPGVIRIRNVSTTGFEIRSQAWDYLGGASIAGKVGYLAMERGSHTLDDGTQVEAGRLDTSWTGSFGKVTFAKPFSVAPVVITGVASVNEESAVVTRVKSLTGASFYVGMQEEEANARVHATETIAYIAWQPSSGTVEGLDFQVGNTTNIVTDKFYTLTYPKATAALPMFLADMQTTNGGDTANLRWQNKSQSSVQVKVAEEQSKGNETSHTKEVVGYILLTPKQ